MAQPPNPPDQIPWMIMPFIPPGQPYFDVHPPEYHNPDGAIIPWWRLSCHNCRRRGHTARYCDQGPYLPRCIYCGREGHTVHRCGRMAYMLTQSQEPPQGHVDDNEDWDEETEPVIQIIGLVQQNPPDENAEMINDPDDEPELIIEEIAVIAPPPGPVGNADAAAAPPQGQMGEGPLEIPPEVQPPIMEPEHQALEVQTEVPPNIAEQNQHNAAILAIVRQLGELANNIAQLVR